MRRGVLVYPMTGTADGVNGDHIAILPPLTIEETHIDFLVDQLAEALVEVSADGAY